MTFSLVGRCRRTGMFGVAISSSSICVGARCPHVRARAGAVATQNVTDPALGPLVLGYLHRGDSAGQALAKARESSAFLEYRQVLVIDRRGHTAIHTGRNILGTHADAAGRDCLAAGNMLRSPDVIHAMVDDFTASEGEHLAERLLRALEQGHEAGGEEGPVHSAALLVADSQPFPLVDLRIDWADEAPIAGLRRLWTDYQPQMQAYVDRATNPTAAPAYGVPGDE
jgi:uncharacterized Ntn-hydrolase superfamily protein